MSEFPYSEVVAAYARVAQALSHIPTWYQYELYRDKYDPPLRTINRDFGGLRGLHALVGTSLPVRQERGRRGSTHT